MRRVSKSIAVTLGNSLAWSVVTLGIAWLLFVTIITMADMLP